MKEKAEKLCSKTKTFILSCNDGDGYPMTKAVVKTKDQKLGELYFITNTSSKFVDALSKNPKSSVYFYSRKLIFYKGCYLKGDMEIVTDMNIKKKYWRNLCRNAYAEKSFADPDFCVLKFTPKTCRYYSNFKINEFEMS